MGRAWSAAHFALFFDLLSTKLLAVEIFSDNEAVIFLLKNRKPNPKNVAAGRGVRELSESNRCLKNRVVRDLSECVT